SVDKENARSLFPSCCGISHVKPQSFRRSPRRISPKRSSCCPARLELCERISRGEGSERGVPQAGRLEQLLWGRTQLVRSRIRRSAHGAYRKHENLPMNFRSPLERWCIAAAAG